ncbi:hypothetical protein HDV00_003036 [Rhizophlyctis rosea]|nr:hypothetical protein HDV00_003036 [Rhizophlyctis rosea]
MKLWCEVYNEKAKEWVIVDPVSGMINDTVALEPPASAPNQCQFSYIVAYEQGFGIKDVTRRYASQYGAKTIKLRLPPGDEGEGWWDRTLWLHSKAKAEEGVKDRREEEDLKGKLVMEAMPSSLAGFKGHALYVLERHLKKMEIIHPSGPQYSIGRFKGEFVYPRTLVKELRTPESWLRLGLQVKEGEEPVKYVTAHAATINRKRAIEMAKIEAAETGKEVGEGEMGDPSKSGVFGEWQTEEYVPGVVVDVSVWARGEVEGGCLLFVSIGSGKIPKNSFGNVEVFHKKMVPVGAAHIQLQGLGRIAKELGIDYAPAVVGFDFNKGRSTPDIKGVVVAKEFEEILLAAYEEKSRISAEQARKKRERAVVGRWRKLVVGLVTRDRLMREYLGEGSGVEESAEARRRAEEEIRRRREEVVQEIGEVGGGGFVVGDDEVEEEDEGGRGRESGGGFFVEDDEVGGDVDVDLGPRLRRRRGGGGHSGGGFMLSEDDDNDDEMDADFRVDQDGEEEDEEDGDEGGFEDVDMGPRVRRKRGNGGGGGGGFFVDYDGGGDEEFEEI